MGDLVELSARRPRRNATSRRMHRKKVVSSQPLTFPLHRCNHGGPCIDRDALPLPPLTDAPMAFTKISGHLWEGVPAAEHIVEGLHIPDNASDELSGQGRSMFPMTRRSASRTIRPMGRGTTPVRFREGLAERLRSARVMAGYETQLQAAQALGIGLDRYRKWESSRTPIPAQYIPAVCDLFGIDANYLFSVQAKAARKIA